MSARASILATQIEYQLRDPKVETKVVTTRRDIDRTVDEFKAAFENLRPELLSAHALAHETVLNAKGRAALACFIAGLQPDGAEEAKACFEQAQACLPDLIDSYLNLIKLYLRAKAEASTSWIAQSEKQLRKVQRLAPDNIQAKYLEAKLAAAAEVRNFSVHSLS